MKTVHEISKISGVSIRTLHHYDEIGLLRPSAVTEAGYRLYDDDSLRRLQLILLYRTLEFPLKDIAGILDSPSFDQNKALEQQIHLLTLRKEHLDNLITFARGVQLCGTKYLGDFTAFDTQKIDDYAAQARMLYGKTDAMKELQEKEAQRGEKENKALENGMNTLFVHLGDVKKGDPCGKEAQAWVHELRSFITEHCYNCTPKILLGLGRMYGGGGSLTENIDALGGKGTAAFAEKAVTAYCEAIKKDTK